MHRISDPDRLLQYAKKGDIQSSAELQVRAARLLTKSRPDRAIVVLENIDYPSLPDSAKAEYVLIRAILAEQSGEWDELFAWLDEPILSQSTDHTLNDHVSLLRARGFVYFGDYPSALDNWLALSDLAQIDNNEADVDAFWETLLNTPESKLAKIARRVRDKSAQGWIQLAMIYQPGKAVTEQLYQLQEWTVDWRGHPASVFLPTDLGELQLASLHPPQRVSLFLPLTGPLAKAGRAVRDGFLAAYYHSLSQSGRNGADQGIEINVVDTHNNDVTELAYNAKRQGTELIIGPLEKSQVAQLRENKPEGVTVLALNSSGGSAKTGSDKQFYEFTLSSEQEARAIARRSFLDGNSRALVIHPDSSWGTRTANSFTEEWSDLGGKVIGTFEFGDHTVYSQLAGQALLISESQKRGKALQSTLRKTLEFEPGRRKDIDMIFIPSNSREARQLKPALNYQFAGSLPVYATSNAYSGSDTPRRNLDIDGLIIPVINWYVPGYESDLKTTIQQSWNSASGQYGPLYAMGADAFQLYPILQQLSALTGSRLEGLTGWISIDKNRKVERELAWHSIQGGRPVPL